jgi:hypothetical protein
VAGNDLAGRDRDGALSQALVSQAVEALPGIRRRILRRGWFLERDLLALLIVLLLAGLAYASVRLQSFAGRLEGPLAEAQAIDPVDPFPELVSTPPPGPAAQTGEDSQSAPQEGGSGPEPASPGEPGSSDEPGDSQAGTSPSLDPEALAEALGELGADLSQQAPTYDLGQALEDLDLEGAAGALDALRDQLDDLAPETREALAEDLQEAAGEVEAAGEPNTADDLREAAGALGEQGQAGENDAAEESLDQLAEDLRALAEALQPSQADGSGAGGGSGSGQSGNPEPAGRLQGEGGELELPLEEEAAQSGLLSPASPDAAGSGTAAGSLDSSLSASGDLASSPLVPNSFLWKWRDVVSSYFHR